jgi:hypothetical protein
VLDLLEKWKQEADETLKTVAPDSDDAASLQAVRRELLFRREDSIRRQVRNVVLTTLTMNGDADAAEAAKRVVQLYDLRSTLVHEGSLTSQELSKGMTDAKNLVERVLRARFLLTAAGRLQVLTGFAQLGAQRIIIMPEPENESSKAERPGARRGVQGTPDLPGNREATTLKV